MENIGRNARNLEVGSDHFFESVESLVIDRFVAHDMADGINLSCVVRHMERHVFKSLVPIPIRVVSVNRFWIESARSDEFFNALVDALDFVVQFLGAVRQNQRFFDSR